MAAVQKVKRCPGCHHTKFTHDFQTASGDLLCEHCGMVQEENPIISEVQFGETSSGAAMVHGAMVGADQARANFNMRNAMESREQTLLNAKQGIRRLGTMLRIPEHIMESAAGWFKLALVQNFVQGRRSNNVIAACLYVACRHEKTHHLLIDFSSKIQISVYSLGATYLKLVRALQIQKLPLADPSLFIQHFAERLNFGDQTAKVCRDATKIAQRMASDWIYEGRRPAGIAGACLLLAARMNNFRRDHGEIVAIARVGEETIQKRLNEFKKTHSGTMSITKFRESERAQPSLPPSFQQNRHIESKITKLLKQRSDMLKSYKRLASQNQLLSTLFSGENGSLPSSTNATPEPAARNDENNEENAENSDSSADSDLPDNSDTSDDENGVSKEKAVPAVALHHSSDSSDSSEDEMYDALPPAPVVKQKTKDKPYKPTTKRLSGLSTQVGTRGLRSGNSRPYYYDDDDEDEEEAPKKPSGRLDRLTTKEVTKKKRPVADSMVENDSLLKSVLAGGELTEKELETALDHIWKGQQKMLQSSLYSIPSEIGETALFVPETEQNSEEADNDSALKEQMLLQQIENNRPKNLLKHCPTTADLLSKISDDPTLQDVEDDDVIEDMLLSKKDAEDKERIWTGLNYDFLIAQEKKILKQAADEISGNTSGQPRKRRRIKDSSVDPVLNDAAVVNAMNSIGENGKAVTPAESAKQLLQSKNFSRKINYTTMSELFNNNKD